METAPTNLKVTESSVPVVPPPVLKVELVHQLPMAGFSIKNVHQQDTVVLLQQKSDCLRRLYQKMASLVSKHPPKLVQIVDLLRISKSQVFLGRFFIDVPSS